MSTPLEIAEFRVIAERELAGGHMNQEMWKRALHDCSNEAEAARHYVKLRTLQMRMAAGDQDAHSEWLNLPTVFANAGDFGRYMKREVESSGTTMVMMLLLLLWPFELLYKAVTWPFRRRKA